MPIVFCTLEFNLCSILPLFFFFMPFFICHNFVQDFRIQLRCKSIMLFKLLLILHEYF